jgi:hypothetical protein
MSTKSQAISSQIEELAVRRQAIWFGQSVEDGYMVRTLTSQLHDLYEERRINDARKRTGDRTEITRQARIETELERLMSS